MWNYEFNNRLQGQYQSIQWRTLYEAYEVDTQYLYKCLLLNFVCLSYKAWMRARVLYAENKCDKSRTNQQNRNKKSRKTPKSVHWLFMFISTILWNIPPKCCCCLVYPQSISNALSMIWYYVLARIVIIVCHLTPICEFNWKSDITNSHLRMVLMFVMSCVHVLCMCDEAYTLQRKIRWSCHFILIHTNFRIESRSLISFLYCVIILWNLVCFNHIKAELTANYRCRIVIFRGICLVWMR